jgi:chaperone modulatory protein CbpM
MNMETREFLLQARLDSQVFDAWIDAGWLLPHPCAKANPFSDLDIARAHLIRDLRDDFGVNDEGISIVLDLIDQVHGLRRTLRDLLASVQAQDEVAGRGAAPSGARMRRPDAGPS